VIAKRKPQHRYQGCVDEECYRLPCQAWREGYAQGREEGREEAREEAAAEAGRK
jgi:hypothetical protein